jgi:hypothetical protein
MHSLFFSSLPFSFSFLFSYPILSSLHAQDRPVPETSAATGPIAISSVPKIELSFIDAPVPLMSGSVGSGVSFSSFPPTQPMLAARDRATSVADSEMSESFSEHHGMYLNSAPSVSGSFNQQAGFYPQYHQGMALPGSLGSGAGNPLHASPRPRFSSNDSSALPGSDSYIAAKQLQQQQLQMQLQMQQQMHQQMQPPQQYHQYLQVQQQQQQQLQQQLNQLTPVRPANLSSPQQQQQQAQVKSHDPNVPLLDEATLRALVQMQAQTMAANAAVPIAGQKPASFSDQILGVPYIFFIFIIFFWFPRIYILFFF